MDHTPIAAPRHHHIRRTLLPLSMAVALLLAQEGTFGQPAATPQSRTVVIRGGTILTVTRGTIRNGTIVLRDGKVAALGQNVDAPSGADVYDATGKFVSPGIIDAHSHIATDAINESATTVSSMTGVGDTLNPYDIDIYRDLAGGVTTANVLHGSANPIGGKNAVIKLRWGKTRARDLFFEGAMPGIKFALGENPKDMRQFGQTGPLRYPVTRPGVEYVIRDAFARAKVYQKAWKDYEARKTAGGADLLPPRRDLQLEPLVEILEGKRLVHAHCYRADEILMLIRLADEVGFKIATFQHVLEGYKVAKEIAAHGAGASTFSDWWGYKIEAADAIPYNAALMTHKGVLVSINSDSAEHARRLNTEAAKAMKWGDLNEDQAIALVTINPAKQLRIEQRVGSLEVGKDADVVVWSHHPLSTYAIVERAYIDGTMYYDRQADATRLTERQKTKETLLAAERQSRPTPAPNPPSTSNPSAGATNGSNGAPSTTTALPQVPQSGPVLAIVNARLNPVTHPVVEKGTIVMRGNRIAALGANVAVPQGAKVIDAGGADVYPGWINARSTIGLAEPGPRGFDDVGEMLEFNPQLRTAVSFNSDSDAIPIARANGVTTVAVTPSGGVLGGEITLMNLDGWTWEENVVKRSVGISFQFPRLTRQAPFGAPPPPERAYDALKKDRDRRLDDLAELLDRARARAKAPAASRPVDLVLDALIPVVERRLPLVATANTEADIRDAVAFAERVGVSLVLSGALEAPYAATLLGEKHVPVILGPVLTLPTREDASHAASYQAAGLLEKAGVTFAFATGDATNVRLLPYQAAQSVAWGLSRDRAIRALTIDAARILGVADLVGSLEPGKIANLVVARGDPLDLRSEVTHVIINGRDVGLANRQLAQFERYMSRP